MGTISMVHVHVGATRCPTNMSMLSINLARHTLHIRGRVWTQTYIVSQTLQVEINYGITTCICDHVQSVTYNIEILHKATDHNSYGSTIKLSTCNSIKDWE